MKKLKLLFAVLALLGGAISASAQEIGDQYVVGTSVYQITGANLITNGSFDDGVNGWYNGAWTANSIENSTVTNTGGYDDGAYITISAAGASSASALRNVISVESGKTYLFRCYTSGQTPSRANIAYSGLWKGTGADGHTEGDQLYRLQWGERCAASTNNWTVNNYIFTPDDYTFVVIRSSWNANTKLDGFFIGEVSKVSDITETVSLGSWTGNASFNGSGQHWDGTNSTKYYDNSSWWSSNTFEDTQDVNLPAGAYVLKAAGRGAANDGTDTYISLDGNNLFFWSKGDTGKGIDTSGAENYSSDGTYANNNNGRGWEWRTLPLLLFEGKNGVTAKFGYRVNYTSKPSSSWSWAGICEPTLYKTELTTAMIFPDLRIAIAKGQKINDKNAGGSRAISDALSAAKAISLSSSVSDATTAYNALLAAIPIASDYAEKYALLDNEITKAAAMDIASSDISTAEAVRDNSSSTADQLVAATQNLKVAEYNYVTTNYQYGVALGEWTSTGTNTSAATFNNQHWSGTTHDYKNQNDNDGQGWNANSWSINFSQDVLLPSGTYVFKVAGRQASGDQVTTSLVVKKGEDVLGTVNDFPRSNSSRGINKSGATAFEGEASEFANGGNGYGWEWRYVKFTLAEEATVNIAINSVATAIHQWVSFGDYTLQADNDDVADILAYNIAKTSAISARDDAQYVNVTGSERTALVSAINADPTSDYSAATTELDNARVAFTGAKTSYDNFVAAKAVEYKDNLPYASSAKFDAIATAQGAADATSAEDAVKKTNAIYSAYRLYVESNALAEGIGGIDKTSLISDANMETTYDGTNHKFGAWQVIGQTNGTIQLLSGESFTDGSGKNDYKYANIHKNDNNAGIQQTISLTPGKYLLTVTARGKVIDGASFKLFADTKNVEIPRDGNAGGTFNRGWNDVSLEFTVTETSDVNIGVQSGNGKDLWWSATRFRLAKIGDVVKLNANGYATYSANYDVEVSGAKAYTAVLDFGGKTITCSEITSNKVPAGKGVLLYGDANADVTLSITADAAALGANNLKATTQADGTLATKGGNSYYALSGNTFKLFESDAFVHNKAYFEVEGGAVLARSMSIVFDGNITGVANVEAAAEAKAKDGKFIENGKLVIVKNGVKYNAAGAKLY